MKGTIFDVQHFSVHDGPGIRCTVFLKGCHLRCPWCHNPEGILIRPRELSFVPASCIGCGKCFSVCTHNVHVMKNNMHVLEREKCERCGECTLDCPTKALSLCGREAEAEEVIAEVLRDKAFYQAAGGLTISGGEPMMQRAFAEELARLGKEAGLNVALETTLCYPYEWLDAIKE
ncbi:MAG: glycyl-radical enzyme activating protein, partial [Treponema sp.]|nr:glycyl-radical enzyme activating protein [Treponema sp.]